MTRRVDGLAVMRRRKNFPPAGATPPAPAGGNPGLIEAVRESSVAEVKAWADAGWHDVADLYEAEAVGRARPTLLAHLSEEASR